MVRLIGRVNDTLFNLEGTHSHPSKDEDKRGYSSAGRAPALQAGGQRFDPAYLHQQDQIEVFGQASEHFDLTLKEVGRMHLEN